MNIQKLIDLSNQAKANQALSPDLSALVDIPESKFVSTTQAVPTFSMHSKEDGEEFCLSRLVLCLSQLPHYPNQQIGISIAEYFIAEDSEEPIFCDTFFDSEIFFVEGWCFINGTKENPQPLENIKSTNGHIVAFCKNQEDAGIVGSPFYPVLFKNREEFEKADRSNIYAHMPLPDFTGIETVSSKRLQFE